MAMTLYRREAGPRRQRGAIGLMAALVMFLLIACVVVALDTGRLYLEKQNLQRVVDLTALTVVAEAEESLAGIGQATLEEAASRNGFEVGSEEEGYEREWAMEAPRLGGLCRLTRGEEGSAYTLREFTPIPDGQTLIECADVEGRNYEPGIAGRNALQVTATLATRASLVESVLGTTTVEMQATATAQRPASDIASFSVGSRLLSADGSGLLGAILPGLDVSAVGYEGLANASVSLHELIDLAADAGTASGLIDGVSLNLAQLANISELQTLSRDNNVSDSTLSAGVDLFADAINLFIDLGLDSVELAELILVDPAAEESALDAQVGLLSLLEAMAFVGNGQFIDVEELGVDLGLLGGLDVVLDVIEPPRIAIGPIGCADGSQGACGGQWRTEARTAQVKLGIGADVNVPLLADVGIRLGVLAAGARAGIDQVEPDGESHQLMVSAYQQPTDIKLDLDIDILGTRVSDLGEVGLASGITSSLGIGQHSPLIGGVVNAASGLLDDLLSSFGSLLGVVPTLDEEISQGGSTISWQDDLETWLADLEQSWGGSIMSPRPGLGAWPAEAPEDYRITFTGTSSDLTSAITQALDEIDLGIDVLGVPLGGLVTPVVSLVGDVLEGVLTDILATQVLEPLLQQLGLNVSGADVEILNYQPGNQGAELVL
ncbi:pilus assembly protein TadG-related protein [Halomonas salifodinae]|uniref:Pilus assembly protein TadG-related protein n=1 Tax=Halomonas salifodinae TaxID=438745 RepID=A0ABW2EWI2_9GAMM